ncbi:MAG TPA: hypothetical protein VGG00_01660 [Rhodanobacter sp.]
MKLSPAILRSLLTTGFCLAMLPASAQSHAPQAGPAHAITSLQIEQPDRKVTGQTLISTHDPEVRIQLPPTARYVGASRWVLYGMADCELHAFVEADAHKNVQRIYWIQFEAYLPSRPELHHTYDSKQHATLGGMDFYVDTWAEASDAKDRPGSDSEHIKALIRAQGYTLPATLASVRFVHLLDAGKRRELMIIYSENADATGFSAADLKPGGRAYSQWPAIEKGLIERSERKISFR